MEELVKYIVKNLVEDKEAVNVTSREEEKAVVVEVTVAPDDTGKVIGKNGKVAQAIRSILHSASYKQTKKYIFKIKKITFLHYLFLYSKFYFYVFLNKS